MKKLWEIYKKHREGIDYLFWGGVAFVLYLLLFGLFLDRLKWNATISAFLDNVIVILFAFFTNKWFVFRSKSQSVKDFFREFVSFGIARIFTMILTIVLTWLGCDVMGYDAESYRVLSALGFDLAKYNNFVYHFISSISDAKIVQFIIQVIVIVSNYVLSKLIVFRKPKAKKETNDTESEEETK